MSLHKLHNLIRHHQPRRMSRLNLVCLERGSLGSGFFNHSFLCKQWDCSIIFTQQIGRWNSQVRCTCGRAILGRPCMGSQCLGPFLAIGNILEKQLEGIVRQHGAILHLHHIRITLSRYK